nr:hypothetical protein [Tanacetum cinerariifolium]
LQLGCAKGQQFEMMMHHAMHDLEQFQDHKSVIKAIYTSSEYMELDEAVIRIGIILRAQVYMLSADQKEILSNKKNTLATVSMHNIQRS